MNEGNYRDYGGGCYLHPKEVVIGVCHLCLNERLLILAAAKHGVNKSNSSKYDNYTSRTSINNSYYDDKNRNNYSSHHHHYHNKPKLYVTLPNKIFAIASFFNTRDKSNRHRRRLHRHRHRHRDSEHQFIDDADGASTSLEDESFISIKFGDNGVASWDKTSGTVSKGVSLEHCSLSWGGQTTVKDASNTTKPKGGSINNGTKSVVEHAKPPPVSMRWRKRISQLLQVIRWKKNSKANVEGNNSKVVEGIKVGRNK